MLRTDLGEICENRDSGIATVHLQQKTVSLWRVCFDFATEKWRGKNNRKDISPWREEGCLKERGIKVTTKVVKCTVSLTEEGHHQYSVGEGYCRSSGMN